jgi:hypothetical protein
MKKSIKFKSIGSIGILLVMFAGSTQGQKLSDIFSNNNQSIIWLGVDFTQVKIMGEMGTVDKSELIPLFSKINLLIVSERDKFNLKDALRKKEIPYDLGIVNKLNYQTDVAQMITTASNLNSDRINKELISDLVKNYKLEGKSGIGVVFFMETLDKTSEKGTMSVTFFSLSNQEVLLTERMIGAADGVGFRNHWANTVYEVINEIKKTKYKEWEKTYSN